MEKPKLASRENYLVLNSTNVKNYYSQYKQDEFVSKVLFPYQKKGFFIDIGAHDGVSLSNTFFLEKNRGWDGICFEPNPEVFTRLDKNRNCHKFNCCIGDYDGNVNFCQVIGYAEMLSGIKESYDPKHVDRIVNEVQLKGGEIKEISVQIKKLSSFECFSNKEVDYMSIDTEGSEFQILKSIDLELICIKSISIENNYGVQDISSYLSRYGYTMMYKLGCDEINIQSKLITKRIKFRLLFWRFFNKFERFKNKLLLC